MKYLSFAIPSFNSEKYLKNCVDSLLIGGDDVEIIIINDGSTDTTLNIANEYKSLYPNIVKVINQENGGHGEGINAGLKESTGLYFKVVDSDDHLYKDGLISLLTTIKKHVIENTLPDFYLCNFVYDHTEDNTYNISSYRKYFTPNSFTTWKNVKHMKYSHMILMHAIVYKKELLIKSEIVLPKHCFYVDNYFAYKPLIYSKSIYYLDVNLYSYFIGREDQSICQKNFTKRYQQQLKVMNLMIDSIKYEDIYKLEKGLRIYLKHALNVINIVTICFTTIGKNDRKERRNIIKDYYKSIKLRDKKMYYFLKYRSYYSTILLIPSRRIKKRIIHMSYNKTCSKSKVG
ncbi:MAG: glycosyltransferase family 2 protein [Bacilli bacterium]